MGFAVELFKDGTTRDGTRSVNRVQAGWLGIRQGLRFSFEPVDDHGTYYAQVAADNANALGENPPAKKWSVLSEGVTLSATTSLTSTGPYAIAIANPLADLDERYTHNFSLARGGAATGNWVDTWRVEAADQGIIESPSGAYSPPDVREDERRSVVVHATSVRGGETATASDRFVVLGSALGRAQWLSTHVSLGFGQGTIWGTLDTQLLGRVSAIPTTMALDGVWASLDSGRSSPHWCGQCQQQASGSRECGKSRRNCRDGKEQTFFQRPVR